MGCGLKQLKTMCPSRNKENPSFRVVVVVYLVYVECECSDCDPHHTLGVIEELDSLRVEREVSQMLGEKGHHEDAVKQTQIEKYQEMRYNMSHSFHIN